MPTKIEKDAVTGRETTGHEWDGIKELNTPLPKWWVYTLYATIAFSVVWMVLYPSVPGLSTYFSGTLGYSQRAEVQARLGEAAAARAPFIERIAAAELPDISQEPDLATFAITGGQALFGENCAACHGAGGAGRLSFPALADDDWIWGGTYDQIRQTITFGIRNQHQQSRLSEMPRYGTDQILTREQIGDVADYVLTLSGAQAADAASDRGQEIYAQNCVACHGERGEGNLELGAPNLTDAIWLYGGDRASIIQQISAPQQGVMPFWTGRLSEAQIKMLTLYVHSLGGGR